MWKASTVQTASAAIEILLHLVSISLMSVRYSWWRNSTDLESAWTCAAAVFFCGATSLFHLADVDITPSSFHRCGERSGCQSCKPPVLSVWDMKPHSFDLGLPHLLYLFKLFALCQTGVSSLCWKFSLCAGHWHCLQKHHHFPLNLSFQKQACVLLGRRTFFTTITVITGKIGIKLETYSLTWTLLALHCACH